jgi:hypothetical protein
MQTFGNIDIPYCKPGSVFGSLNKKER